MQAHLLTLLSVLSLTAAVPTPQWGGSSTSDPVCVPTDRYSITHQSAPFWAWPRLVAGEQCVANTAGVSLRSPFTAISLSLSLSLTLTSRPQCTISDAKSYSVEVIITKGVSLDIAKIVGVGISGSIAVGTTNSETVITGVNCPPGCTCGVQVQAQKITVSGEKSSYAHNMNGKDDACVKDDGTPEQYQVDLPVLVKGGAKNNEAVARFSACRVAHTFCLADKGLPLCPKP